MIKNNKLSRSSIELTSLSLGTAGLGNLYREISDSQSWETLDRSWEMGIRYFDTAPLYGYGLSEKRVGEFLKTKPEDDYVLSTKVGCLLEPGMPPSDGVFINGLPFTPYYDYSYEGVMRSIEDSYHRLGRRKIDLVYLHDLGRMTHGEANDSMMKQALEGGVKALEELKRNRFITAIGLGVNEVEVCLDWLERSDPDVFLLAGRYTLLEQGPLNDLFPECKKRGVDLVIGGVFNSGILVDDLQSDQPKYNYRLAPQSVVDRVKALATVCETHGLALPAAALQFAGLPDLVKTVLVGAKHSDQIRQAHDWLGVTIPETFWQELKTVGLLDRSAPISFERE